MSHVGSLLRRYLTCVLKPERFRSVVRTKRTSSVSILRWTNVLVRCTAKRDRETIPITCLCFVSPNPPNDKIMFSQPNLLNQHKCKAVGAFTTMLCHKRIINVSTLQLNKRTLEVNEIAYLHQACQQCKERKGRCDGGQPCCNYCFKYEKHCIYTVRRRRGPGKR